MRPIRLISFGYLHLPTGPDGAPVPLVVDSRRLRMSWLERHVEVGQGHLAKAGPAGLQSLRDGDQHRLATAETSPSTKR
ncbi:hypothetical protein [Streptomyces sp. cmx-4-9]|uniref:hypothetical protein n=1 Tax=Streptomyces sp. cmx-4-9 TaxID=2790941 RepID=UPI00397FE123